LRAVVNFDQPIPAPITKGERVGEMVITAPGMEAKTIPLVASSDVEQVGFFSRVYQKLGVIF
jgi:D-alanyl-D-alanine carboxypeptidase (penicillin-binding protein 5/6)